MVRFSFFLLAAMGLLVLIGLRQHSAGQSPTPPRGENAGEKGAKPREDRHAEEEAKRIRKALEKASRPVETVRDHLVKELNRLPALDAPPAAEPRSEFQQWFTRLSNGQSVWRRNDIRAKGLREVFDRIIQEQASKGEELTREQFLRYAWDNLRPENATPWKVRTEGHAVTGESDKLFAKVDHNRDGVVDYDEMSDSLRAERSRWDSNGDGVIDRNEYLKYFEARVERLQVEVGTPAVAPSSPPAPRSATPPGPRSTATLPPPEQPALAPSGKRSEKQSATLPEWFRRLDTDQDGQVALYEWKDAGLPVEVFQNVDGTGDGLITREEVVRYLKHTTQQSPAVITAKSAPFTRQ